MLINKMTRFRAVSIPGKPIPQTHSRVKDANKCIAEAIFDDPVACYFPTVAGKISPVDLYIMEGVSICREGVLGGDGESGGRGYWGRGGG